MGYPGGKGLAGLYQKIIALIPPHETYIETHLGSGAIFRNKKLAKCNIGVDIDPDVLHSFKFNDNLIKKEMDAVDFLKSFQFNGTEFVYSDPPYIKDIRKNNRNIYRYEYSIEDHKELLNAIKILQCNVMISGYWSELYAEELSHWHSVQIKARTRSGEEAIEWIWMNYECPMELHDYRYTGINFRERERIKRKTQRWLNRLNTLPPLERQAIIHAISIQSSQSF